MSLYARALRLGVLDRRRAGPHGVAVGGRLAIRVMLDLCPTALWLAAAAATQLNLACSIVIADELPISLAPR